jgi:hypothetical protein
MTEFRLSLIKRYQKLDRTDDAFIMACRLFPETILNNLILEEAIKGYEAEAKEEEATNAPLMVCRLNEDGKTYWTERK